MRRYRGYCHSHWFSSVLDRYFGRMGVVNRFKSVASADIDAPQALFPSSYAQGGQRGVAGWRY